MGSGELGVQTRLIASVQELGVKSGESHFFSWNSELFYPMPHAQCPMPNN
ncbi:MAG: hypothetical protein V7K27_13500 [Nostoc sp.]